MTDYGEEYLSIFDYLKTKLEEIQVEGQSIFENVVQGWKSPVRKTPAAFIIPDPDIIDIATVRASEHTYRFIIVVLVEKADILQGLRDAISKVGKVIDTLENDRRLNDLVDRSESRRVEFHWRRQPGYVRHWCALHFEAYKVRTSIP